MNNWMMSVNGGNEPTWLTEGGMGHRGCQGKAWAPRKEGRKKKKEKKKGGDMEREVAATGQRLQLLDCICPGPTLSLAFTSLLWMACFLISKMAGSFCESTKKARVQQEGAGRQLPIGSLGSALLDWPVPNGTHRPETETRVLALLVQHHSFDSVEQLSFLFRAHLTSRLASGTPVVRIPLSPSKHPLHLPPYFFTLLAHFSISILPPRPDT